MIGFGSWGKRVFKRLKNNQNIKILFVETKNNDYSNIYHKVRLDLYCNIPLKIITNK